MAQMQGGNISFRPSLPVRGKLKLVQWLTALTGCTLVGAACNSPAEPRRSGCDPSYEFIADRVRAIEYDLQLRGVALLVVRDGRTLCEMYSGQHQPDTRVALLSAVKWLTAITIMTVVDEKKLSLDTRVAALIPTFTKDKGAVTLRQLLSHTSGLQSEAPCMTNRNISLANCADSIGLAPSETPPGAFFAYAGSPFTVAGRMAEIASGKSWEQLFTERVVLPLGLEGTGYGAQQNPILDAGYAYGTLRDYARVLQMLRDGGAYAGRRVLSQQALTEMFRDQTGGVKSLFPPRDTGTCYGLGVWCEGIRADGTVFRVGSPGATGVIPWLDLDQGVIGLFVTNTPFDDVHTRVGALKDEIRDSIARRR